MSLFAYVAKLGSGAYGARHARARLSAKQWLLAVRETMVINPGTLNIMAQSLSNSLTRSLPQPIYTPLSIGWTLTRLQASRLVESIMRTKEMSRSMYTSPTPSGKPDGVSRLHYTCPNPEASLSTCHLVKRKGGAINTTAD